MGNKCDIWQRRSRNFKPNASDRKRLAQPLCRNPPLMPKPDQPGSINRICAQLNPMRVGQIEGVANQGARFELYYGPPKTR